MVGRLFQPMNSTAYCATVHKATRKKIVSNGKIVRNDFLNWYLVWIFGGDDKLKEDEEDVKEGTEESGEGTADK